MPLSFEENNPVFNSLNSWDLNETTGEWQVSDDNNYLKNPSFEADRRTIPSPVKPIQAHITGWITHIYQGNTVVVGEDESPQLNYFNTREDRKMVIGEKSLNIEDKVPFKRRVYQMIESTSFVELPEGTYGLSAWIKTNSKFNCVEIYAESGGIKTSDLVEMKDSSWSRITLNNVEVKNGKVEIGFYADGKAHASCQIDDVEFVKTI